MKKIFLWLGIFLAVTVSPAPAQDAATQQQLDKLFGQIQDMQAAQELQGKRLAALEKQISDLAEKVNTPPVNDSASREDVKTLAAKVQEIDRKRQDDRDLILKEIEKLGKVSAAPAAHRAPPAASKTADDTAPATPQKGYEYTIKPGDTVSAIAKEYRAQGVKVTTTQIIAANPKLNPNSLIAGKKLFIPDANAK